MTDDERDSDQRTLDAIRRQRLGLRSALGGLEAAVAAPASGRQKEWVANLIDKTRDLRAAFADHIEATEGRGGLFEEVLGEAPRLSNQVNKLRTEHVTITAGLDALIVDDGDDADVAAVRESAVRLMGHIVNHRADGSSLIYEAYFVDIDAAD